jgi:hypothetical protein
MDTNPFIGLRPYGEAEQMNFIGREEEVEYLLQIIQKNKLITLTGSSGSGKTSLINAGLIPRLRKGFLGQAGKEWAICSFRPGIAPIENLMHGLTRNGTLRMEEKSNTEDLDNYLKVMEDSGHLGIVDIYKSAEIYNRKNLLIIIDQLEDLFQFQRFFDANQSLADDLLLDMVARTVRVKETAIYFVISIQTPFVSELSQYIKLQEIISKSQYSIQHLKPKYIAEIFKRNFIKNKIYFEDNAVNEIIHQLSSDISLLSNFQFLCHSLFEKYHLQPKEGNAPITLEEVDEMGNVHHCLNNALEQFFADLSESEKENFEKMIRAYIVMGERNFGNNYQTLGNILQSTNLTKSVVSKMIFDFKAQFGDSLEFMEPVITGKPLNNRKELQQAMIVNNKYFTFRNWSEEKNWIEQERHSFDQYLDFAIMAKKYNSGDGSLLISPELELAEEWRKNPIHNLAWSTKYKENFEKTTVYIDDSISTALKIKQNEEIRLIKKRRLNRQFIGTLSVLMVVALGMFFSAYKSGKEAEKSAEKALVKTEEAIKAQEAAKKSAEAALASAKTAEARREEAAKAMEFAEKERIKAEKEKLKAENARKDAEKNEKIAKDAVLEAEENKLKAIEEAKKAQDAKKNTQLLKDIAEMESTFYPTMMRLERLIDLSNEGSTDEENDIYNAISSALVKYKDFQDKKEKTDTEDQDTEGVYMLLQTALMVLEGSDNYTDTSMQLKKINPSTSIRSIGNFDNSITAFGGDDGNLYAINSKEGFDMIPIRLKERIRSVVFTNPNEVIVGTFKGNVYRVLLNKKFSPSEDRIFNVDSPIKEIYHDVSQNELLILSENQIAHLDLSSRQYKTNIIENSITASYFDGNQIVMAAGNHIYTYRDGALTQQSMDSYFYSKSSRYTAILLERGKLFLGNSVGEIAVYTQAPNKNWNFLNKIPLHRTQITKLLYDTNFDILYSSSLDNQILKFKIKGDDIEGATNNAISLLGHTKWVWDLNLSEDENGKKILITVDEDGNALSWFCDQHDLAKKVEILLDEKFSE